MHYAVFRHPEQRCRSADDGLGKSRTPARCALQYNSL